MNKKQLVEYLKLKMPTFEGTEDEKKIKTALYIYIELGKMKAFDEKYFFGNAETKKKIVRKAKSSSNSIDELAQKRKITCITLTKLYCSILNEFGIKSYESQPEYGDEHIYPIIEISKDKKIIADLQIDLTNIQTRSRLKSFKYYTDKKQNQEFLNKLLIEIGYITKEEDYKDEKIIELKEKIKELNVKDSLKIILSDDEINADNVNLEIVELNIFYRGVLKELLKEDLDNKVYIFNCYRVKEDKKEYIPCIFSVYKDNVKCYLYSKRNNRFQETALENIEALEKEGLVLGTREKENGSRKLKKYMKLNRKKDIYQR